MKIAVIYSEPSKRQVKAGYGATDDDSAVIAEKVVAGLRARGLMAEKYLIGEDEIEKIGEIRAGCIFNLIEWCGQDIHLAQKAFGFLRALNIPVTGSSEELFVLTGDKSRVKEVLVKMGVSTPQAMLFKTGDEPIPDNLPYPMIVKPSLEHCSMGLTQDSITHNAGDLRRIAKKQIETFEQSALAEEFIVGREFLVYLIEEKGGVRVLPIKEIMFSGYGELQFQTYEAKWDENHQDYQTTEVVLAKLSVKEKKKIESLCTKIFKRLGLWGYARFDVRYRSGKPYILETNANPSVYDSEDETLGAEDEVIWGIKFGDYLEGIVQSAVYHFERGERV